MRQLSISVPEGDGIRVQELADKHKATNLIKLRAEDQEQDLDIVIFNVSNKVVGDVLAGLDGFENVSVTLHPQDVFPLPHPQNNVPDQVTNVTHRSPIEVWLNGLQSIGSWKGFLGYAVAASIIVWIGMFTNTAYLLVGAMLVSPFAGPAMNFALSSAAGDGYLMRRNLMRYFTSLLVTILVSAALSLIFQQHTVTNTMVRVSEISSIAVLLPLTAGAVGAHNLSQPNNSSLVPGAAVGTLVAASLAPPAGLVGMSMALGRWDMAISGTFLLILQLCAINLSGMLVFQYYGQKPGNVVVRDPNPKLPWISLIVSAAALAGILAWQFSASPNLQRSSRAQRAAFAVQQAVQEDPRVNLLEINMRFPRPTIENQNALLGTVYVERKPDTQQPADEIEQELTQAIQQRILNAGFQVIPLISVTVLDPPDR